MLEKIISQLIFKHACVIVPNLGGFISQRVSATWDQNTGKMLPPSKSVLFNKQLLVGDGLLVGTYANALSISYEEASVKIEQQVVSWKQDLLMGNRVAIDTIGFLYTDQLGSVRFEQDKFVNLLLSSYGLPNLSVPSIQQIEKPVEEVVAETKTIDFIDFNSVKIETVDILNESTTDSVVTKSSWMKYVAAAALLPIAFYSFWIPAKTDFLQSGIISIHDFNPFNKTEKIELNTKVIKLNTSETVQLKNVKKEVEEANVDVAYSYEVDEQTYQKIEVAPEVLPTESIQSTAVISSKNGYYLIANCFKLEENANEFVKEMTNLGFQSEVVDFVNGLHRVSIASTTDEEKLAQLKEQVVSKGITNFWILKK